MSAGHARTDTPAPQRGPARLLSGLFVSRMGIVGPPEAAALKAILWSRESTALEFNCQTVSIAGPRFYLGPHGRGQRPTCMPVGSPRLPPGSWTPVMHRPVHLRTCRLKEPPRDVDSVRREAIGPVIAMVAGGPYTFASVSRW